MLLAATVTGPREAMAVCAECVFSPDDEDEDDEEEEEEADELALPP